MTSSPPLAYGSYYHIYNRGNNGENIFIEERNYAYFMQLFARYLEPVVDTFAYCLLRNHFHLLVRVKTREEIEANSGQIVDGGEQTLRVSKQTLRVITASQQFGNLFNAYAKAVNRAYQRTGSLFENPFGRVLVQSEAHLVHLVAYIHRNPQKHGFVQDYRDWPYSSFPATVSGKPTRLKRDEVMNWFGGLQGLRALHTQAQENPRIAYLTELDSSDAP
jgi:REP element-mobilizing transposase RayT